MLKVENIGKSFGKNEVLKDISFSLNKGEVLAIIGSSGSGKTTLLRCLNFLETPQKGKISVGDEVLFDSDGEVAKSDLDIRRKRLHFGLVFQNFNLFPQYKVIENITLAPTLMAKEQLRENGSYKGAKNMKQAQQAIREEAESLLKRVGLYEKRNSYPCDLSGGQQQRVAIARALALDPNILCEIGFAHDVADRIIFMDGGLIEEEGTPQEVIDNPKSARTREFLARFNQFGD